MTVAASVFDEAVAAGLLLSRRGEHIHIESPLGRPLLEELRQRIVCHRDELLAYFDWREAADELLLETSRRIAARYTRGCPLEGDRWSAAEEALHTAHRSQDLAAFQEALERYKAFALDQFVAHKGSADMANETNGSNRTRTSRGASGTERRGPVAQQDSRSR